MATAPLTLTRGCGGPQSVPACSAVGPVVKKYNYGQLELAVADAIVSGILDRSRLPADLVEALGRAIAFYSLRNPRPCERQVNFFRRPHGPP